MAGGSPLAVHTQRLAAAVQQRLPQARVVHAMRYGEPAIAGRARARCAATGVQRVLVLPLYPQYSTTTTASVDDVVAPRRATCPRASIERLPPSIRAGSRAVADSIRAHWAAHGRGDTLLFSFHGLPQRAGRRRRSLRRAMRGQRRARSPPRSACATTTYVLTYQSRFGRERWLEPATADDARTRWPRAACARVDVVCPGFAVDCLETLEEIAMMNAEAFRDAGGEALRYIPCLNDAPAHADALAALARTARCAA